MTGLRNIFTLLIALSLISCDDKGAKSTTPVAQTPDIDIFQTSTEIEQLQAKLLSNQNEFGTLSVLGDRLFESARYLEAIQTYDKALAVNPACADCLNDKGLALFYSGDPLAALESFDQAIAQDPGFTRAWLSKGFVLFSTGRYQEAIAPLKKVKELETSGGLALEADKFLARIAEMNIQ